MVKINFCGVLGDKYQSTRLKVNTPAEVMGLLEANNPGIRAEMISLMYAMVLYNPASDTGNSITIGHETSNIKISEHDEVYFVPKANGEAGTAIFWLTSQIVTYTGVTSMTGVYIAAAAATVIVAAGYIGISMGLSSLADSLMPGLEDDKFDPGAVFSGAINLSRQGAPVPVCYGGPIRVGSQVVSVALSAS